jgi:hypothetical protein
VVSAAGEICPYMCFATSNEPVVKRSDERMKGSEDQRIRGSEERMGTSNGELIRRYAAR